MFSPGNLRATFDNPNYEKLINYYVGEKYTLRYTGEGSVSQGRKGTGAGVSGARRRAAPIARDTPPLPTVRRHGARRVPDYRQGEGRVHQRDQVRQLSQQRPGRGGSGVCGCLRRPATMTMPPPPPPLQPLHQGQAAPAVRGGAPGAAGGEGRWRFVLRRLVCQRPGCGGHGARPAHPDLLWQPWRGGPLRAVHVRSAAAAPPSPIPSGLPKRFALHAQTSHPIACRYGKSPRFEDAKV